MGDALGIGTTCRIAALFAAAERAEVAGLLVAECDRALPFADTLGAAGIERVQFAVLKIGGGSVERLRTAVGLARQDWRDALLGAGFGDDARARLAWLPDAKPAAAADSRGGGV